MEKLEIKYRAIGIDKPEWIYGYVAFDSKKLNAVIIHKQANNEMQHTAVEPETVGQYTGLKDIYEGDILSNKWKVEVYCNKNTGAWMVKFNTNPSGNKPKTLYKYLQSRELAGCPEDLEIIGNIYQNPELLTPPYIGTK